MGRVLIMQLPSLITFIFYYYHYGNTAYAVKLRIATILYVIKVFEHGGWISLQRNIFDGNFIHSKC